MSSQGESTLPLVRVKEKFQVTIPTELREALHLAVGDILEATIEHETICAFNHKMAKNATLWLKPINATISLKTSAASPQA
jgi:AbrB family looped-hinge helix DNA binding protein